MKKLKSVYKKIAEINERELGIFDLELIYDTSIERYVIVDYAEELYYGGYAFDRILEELESSVKNALGNDAYLDCACPGRWILAD